MTLPSFDGYQLDEILGQSALGVTYAGQWRATPIVVKVIEMGATLSETEQRAVRDEFRRRTEAVSALFHPGIVALRDYGQAPPYLYAISGFQAAGSLSDPEGRRLFATPLDLPQTLAYARQIGEALGEAHRRGVAHGNLKPSNIFLRDTLTGGASQMAIGDFALVSVTLRSTVRPLGQEPEWRYLAPDSLNQAPTPGGDVFALAALCYEWLSGRPAFDNVSPTLRRPLTPITTVRTSLARWPELDALFARALAPTPNERYASVAAFLDALQGIAEPTSAPSPARRDDAPPAPDPNDTRPSREMPAVPAEVQTLPLTPPAPPAQQHSPSAFLLDSPIGPKPPTADLRRMERDEALALPGASNASGAERQGRRGDQALVRGPTTREQDLMAPAAPRRRARARGARDPRPHAPIPLPPEALGLPLAVPVPRRSALARLGQWAILGAVALGGTAAVAEGIAHLASTRGARSTPAAIAPPILLGSHPHAITALAWSPDGTRVASGAQGDGTLLFWSPDRHGSPTGQLVTGATTGGITALSWARDSRYLLASLAGQPAQIWNVGQGQAILHLPYAATLAQWHPTLDVAALSVAGKTPTAPPNLVLWDIGNAQLLATLTGHAAPITALTWWPGATALLLATGDAGGSAIVWGGSTASALAAATHLTTATSSAITGLSWSSQQQRLALGSQDGTLRLFAAQQSASLATWGDATSGITALAWQPATPLVAVAHATGACAIWDSTTNRLVTTLPGTTVPSTCLAWSTDGRWLTGGTTDGRILLWDVRDLA